MVSAARQDSSQNTQIELDYLGGAAGRVSASENGFWRPQSTMCFESAGDWREPAEMHENVSGFGACLTRAPHMKPGVYVIF